MIVRLLVSNDKANVKKVVLRSDTVIGRSSDCNLRIASKEVSRKHCSILLSERAVRVRDLGSANGTFLNGSQLEANVDVPAPPGSELEVGNVRFVINYDSPATADLEASTAEVPNAVLQARLARQAGDSGTRKSDRPGTVPRSDVLRSPGGESGAGDADSQMDTHQRPPASGPSDAGDSDSSEETFNAADPDDDADRTVDDRGNRRVDDDTFALKEADVADVDDPQPAAAPDACAAAHPSRAAAPDACAAAHPSRAAAAAQELSGVDETISMQADDLMIDARSAVKQAAPDAKETPRKGWKSVFGLFGGKPQPPAEQPPAETEAADVADDERRLEPATDRGPDPERNRKTVPEFVLPPRENDQDAVPGTEPEFELPPADASPNDTIHLAAEETISPRMTGEKPVEPAADDTNLQDFFRQLPKE